MKFKMPSLQEIVRKVYDGRTLQLGTDSTEAKILAIDKFLAAKVYFNLGGTEIRFGKDASPEKRAKKEFGLGRFFLSQKICVPRMYQLISPNADRRTSETDIINWIVLMERIHGSRLSSLYFTSEWEDAYEKWIAELAKIKKLGYIDYDKDITEEGNASNAIYSSEKKVYLIDFSQYKHI